MKIFLQLAYMYISQFIPMDLFLYQYWMMQRFIRGGLFCNFSLKISKPPSNFTSLPINKSLSLSNLEKSDIPTTSHLQLFTISTEWCKVLLGGGLFCNFSMKISKPPSNFTSLPSNKSLSVSNLEKSDIPTTFHQQLITSPRQLLRSCSKSEIKRHHKLQWSHYGFWMIYSPTWQNCLELQVKLKFSHVDILFIFLYY